jgi:hypothetical protein
MRERERAKRGNKGRTQRLPAESTAHTHTHSCGWAALSTEFSILPSTEFETVWARLSTRVEVPSRAPSRRRFLFR